MENQTWAFVPSEKFYQEAQKSFLEQFTILNCENEKRSRLALEIYEAIAVSGLDELLEIRQKVVVSEIDWQQTQKNTELLKAKAEEALEAYKEALRVFMGDAYCGKWGKGVIMFYSIKKLRPESEKHGWAVGVFLPLCPERLAIDLATHVIGQSGYGSGVLLRSEKIEKAEQLAGSWSWVEVNPQTVPTEQWADFLSATKDLCGLWRMLEIMPENISFNEILSPGMEIYFGEASQNITAKLAVLPDKRLAVIKGRKALGVLLDPKTPPRWSDNGKWQGPKLSPFAEGDEDFLITQNIK
ncbi:MAG: hypothetical protein Q8Q23_05360 [bacterium]|nr:hypothetical protein [bacterium]